jgi:lysyl-tRNA synthetase, class I
MLWFSELAGTIDASRPHVINDSKTPSGRVHVGALRGVVMHDAVFRVLKERGVAVRYLFGVDDYDPLDELPAGQAELFTPYLGAPLCNVPPPPGSPAPDMAEHFIREFFDVFRELGVEAVTYRMRDHYRSGRFNEVIDTILRSADAVRRVYKEVSNSTRSPSWYPFQTVCEQCGRIGTTEVTAYDGKEVEYTCRADLVKWARGCGYHGKISPFDGRGKLPWKLEWVAKWKLFGVTIEGAGKDHTTKGGSRDVAAACLRAIFGQEPPQNIPYEFFLVGGAKMSSSKGVGASSREMADFLPPPILRFLILRTQPSRPVNFALNEEFMVKLFNELDRLHHRSHHDPAVREEEKQLFRLCETGPEAGEDFFDASFQLILTFIQMPHVDLGREMEKRKGSPLTEVERRHLDRRAQAARIWLDRYAAEEDKLHLQETLPARAAELGHAQRAFLHAFARELPGTPRDDDALQAKVFDLARRTPLDQPAAFKALYRVLLDREQGPRAGALMAVLERSFLEERFTALPYSEAAFWRETAQTKEALEAWLGEERAKLTAVSTRAAEAEGTWAVELTARTSDQKTFVRRVVLGTGEEGEAAARRYAEELSSSG